MHKCYPMQILWNPSPENYCSSFQKITKNENNSHCHMTHDKWECQKRWSDGDDGDAIKGKCKESAVRWEVLN